MREIKLKIDQRFNVRILLLEYLRAHNIGEFYEKNIKAEDKTITVFAYETVYTKTAFYGGRGIHYDVTATITLIVSEKRDSTAVAFILPSDAPNDTLNAFDLKLKDNGFRYI